MATPDDLEEFRSCQKTYLATAAPWNDMSRGAEHWIEGPDDDAKTLGLDPVSSGVRTEDEGLFIVQHGYWKKALQQGLEIEAAEAEGRGQRPDSSQLIFPPDTSLGVENPWLSR